MTDLMLYAKTEKIWWWYVDVLMADVNIMLIFE